MTERFSPQQPLPVVNLSVTGFAVTAPLVGEPLAGRRVFGVWCFAPFGSAGVMFTSAAEVALGADRRKDRKMNLMPRPPLLGNDDDRRQWRKQGGVVGAAASRVRVHLHEATAGSRNPDRWHRASAMMTERFCTKKRPHHSKEQWGRFGLLQWVPLTQPWGLREPLPPQPLRRALPERQERQRASEPASPRAWGDSGRPSAGRG